jgi:hypothetical protein
MKKLLRPKDILLLTLAGVGDVMEEVRDPLRLMSSAYDNMYGFIPRRYKRHNFIQMVGRSLRTGDIEKVVKNGKAYLRLTSVGKNRVKRDFPVTGLTKRWNGRWTTLIFDIEEKSRKVRDSLRSRLRNIGFGMLQESVWITPLQIGEDVWEFIESLRLKTNVFVMEVVALKLSDPKELASKIWHLDKYEEEYFRLKKEMEVVDQLTENNHDRESKREAKSPSANSSSTSGSTSGVKIYNQRGKISDHSYRYKNKKRVLMKRYLELITSLPPLPRELLPEPFKNL